MSSSAGSVGETREDEDDVVVIDVVDEPSEAVVSVLVSIVPFFDITRTACWLSSSDETALSAPNDVPPWSINADVACSNVLRISKSASRYGSSSSSVLLSSGCVVSFAEVADDGGKDG